MSDQIEIYVRDSGDRTLLNVFVPSRMREQLIAALQHGSFSGCQVPIALEMPILDKWITADGQARDDEIGGEPEHVRVPITGISVHFTE